MKAANRKQIAASRRLELVKKPVHRVGELRLAQATGTNGRSVTVREGTTGRYVSLLPTRMLPKVWGMAAGPQLLACPALRKDGEVDPGVGMHRTRSHEEVPAAQPEMAFYRKYTEAMLRRYLRMSMSAGRVSTLLGRELFRGKVTNYTVQNFEDISIFCVDVEACLAKLGPMERALLRRIAVQEYSQGEAAAVLGLSLRSCERRYPQALDKLTRILLDARLLEPLKSCQGGREVLVGVSD
jgi:predicted DNA-binding protein (UPF0251 family)